MWDSVHIVRLSGLGLQDEGVGGNGTQPRPRTPACTGAVAATRKAEEALDLFQMSCLTPAGCILAPVVCKRGKVVFRRPLFRSLRCQYPPAWPRSAPAVGRAPSSTEATIVSPLRSCWLWKDTCRYRRGDPGSVCGAQPGRMAWFGT